MTAGRKSNKADVVEVIDPKLDQPKIENAMVQMRTDGLAERQARESGIFDLGRQVGAIQMANVQTDFLAVARIKLFDEIKESNKYKDLAITGPDGNRATARSLEDFCELVFGVPYRKMAEASNNLLAIGESSFESAQRLGLTRKQLRLIRSLPDAQRTAVAEAIQAESKAEVVAIIEDLAAQLGQSQNDTAEARAEIAAKEQLLTDKNVTIDKLKTDLVRNKNLKIAATDWPERFKGLIDQAQFAHKNIRLCIGSLDAIRISATEDDEPADREQAAALQRAREVLADELLGIYRKCADYLENMGVVFDQTLGCFASEGR